MPSAINRLLQRAGLIRSRRQPEASAADALPEVQAPPPTDRVSLQELITRRRAQSTASQAERLLEATGLLAPLEEVYAVSGVEPLAERWSAERVLELLSELGDMDPIARKQRLLEALVADGISPAHILRHTLARDEALDAWEVMVRGGVEQTLADLEAEERSLRDETQRRLDQLEAHRAALRESFSAWQQNKAEIEDRWTAAIAALVGGQHDFRAE